MARINRSDIIQKAVNDLGISQSGEKIPNETLDKVQLTYNLNRAFSNFVTATSGTTTGTQTITLPTVSVGADTYITSICFTMIKDATCDVASGRLPININPDASNVASNILAVPCLTLTAQSETVMATFPYPIKVRNGSNITQAATFTAGAMARSIQVAGFTTSSN